MARDFAAEIARAEEKIERIKKARDEALRRKREPIGKVMLELFPDLEKLDKQRDIKAFIEAHLQTIDSNEREDTVYDVSDDDFAEPTSFDR